MQLGPLGQISRRVEDVARATAFLRDVVGLPLLYTFPGLAFFDLGGTRLMLRETGQRTDADILYFRCTGIEQNHRRLAEKGAVLSGAPHMIHRHPDGTEEWMAFFKDDEDRDLALVEAVSPRPS